ncbi:MAG TPA: FimV/HubP family polar landmark protein [Gallionella sp.]|nr:FimV/HubP family polar landmark protein [Gallionella sp.]
MGGINVASALGQPLKADIELVVVSKTDKASLVARLASPDVYRGAGLEYPYGTKFKFQIESRANGEPYIKVSSAQPINDPFVSMLVELTWASGKLLREYTFLLDPPDYVAEQPKPAEVQAVAPAVQSAPPETTAKPVEQAAPVAAAPVEIQPVEKPAEKPASKPVMAAPAKPATAAQAEKSVATGSITVHRGDTLNKIAVQNKPAEVSLERMLVALYRANADQFDGKNMNRIKAGKILRLPDQGELMGVAQSDAAKEIRAQTADWNAYRQKLAGAAPAASQPQEAQQVATGKIASSVADKAPVAKESAKEVLKLSKGEAPGDKAAAGAAGKSMSAQDKKNAEQEDTIAKAKGLKEEQARAALLEKNLQDMQRLAQLKSEAAALAQPSGAASAVSGSASAVAAASSVAAASEVKPAPVAKPKPKPQPVVVPQPSMVDKILGEPLYLIGGAAILLGLGGIGLMLSRRKQASAAATGGQSEEVGAITGHITAPVAPSPETGDFTSAATVHAETTPQADDVDPISEADLFLNFGRDAQAEEILKEALQNTPNNHQIHLKLLGIYAARKDVNSFSVIARQLKDSGDEEAWSQAAAMGRKLEPNNPMYGGARTIEDDGSATMQTTVLNAMPDFASDDTAAEETSTPDVDFDLGDTEKTSTLSTDDKAAAQAETMDFDVTSTRPPLSAPTEMDFDITSTSPSMPAATGEPETALPNLDDLIFDVTSTHPSMPAAQPEASKPAAQVDDGGMEFTLDFPVEGVAEKPAPVAQAEAGLAGISLNFDAAATPGEPLAEAKDEHWHEVATKLDLAKAYQEMGDATGAREILDEVLREGDAGQCEAAQSMLDQLG